MSNLSVDVMLHIKETLQHEQLESIRDNLMQLEGVTNASFHDEKPHLIMLEYDPDRINSSDILESAKGLDVQAKLVGL